MLGGLLGGYVVCICRGWSDLWRMTRFGQGAARWKRNSARCAIADCDLWRRRAVSMRLMRWKSAGMVSQVDCSTRRASVGRQGGSRFVQGSPSLQSGFSEVSASICAMWLVAARLELQYGRFPQETPQAFGCVAIWCKDCAGVPKSTNTGGASAVMIGRTIGSLGRTSKTLSV